MDKIVLRLQWLNHVKDMSTCVFCQFQASKHHNFRASPITLNISSQVQTDPVNTQWGTSHWTTDEHQV